MNAAICLPLAAFLPKVCVGGERVRPREVKAQALLEHARLQPNHVRLDVVRRQLAVDDRSKFLGGVEHMRVLSLPLCDFR